MKNKKYFSLLGLVPLLLTVFWFGSQLEHVPKRSSETPAPKQQLTEGAGILPGSQTFPLIVSGEDEAPIWISKTPAAHRSRIIYPDAALLAVKPVLQIGDRLELALFEDVLASSEISDVTEYPNGAVGMTAKMEGQLKGTLYLSYSGGELRLHADVLGGNDFYVRYDPKLQAHVAIEVDRKNSDIQEECETCREEQERFELEELAAAEIKYNNGDEQVAVEMDAYDDPLDTVVVDVMLVYTPAARIAEGGTNGINNNITLAMQKANAAHGNSNTKMSMNLVHSAETTYAESGSASTDLNALRNEGDGKMEDVHAWRNTYNADFVCLLEDEPGTGGAGELMDDADGEPHRAFCLARVQQSDFSFTVVHEFGHNMGCHHSKTQTTQSGPGFYSYSAGWQWNDTKSNENRPYTQVGYCSLMTYENFDSAGDREYERVPHFSNPDIDFTGNSTTATGDAANGDNARSIRNVRYMVSEYRFPAIKISQFPSTNDFEIGFNPWTYYTDEVDWVLNSGGTTSRGTGPSSAHEGSRYCYVEASGNTPYKTAVLEVEFDFLGVSDPKISYAYHMYSSDDSMGDLYLDVSTNSGGSWITLWSESGNQGNTWFTNQVDLAAYEGESSVGLRFRGVTGDFIKSDMALDSIVVSGNAFDTDDDGIPNTWETLYFGGPTNAPPGGNSDGDEFTNLQEYIAGLNPTNSDSFEVYNLNVGASNWFEWSPKTDRLYSVYWTDDLCLNPFILLQSNLTSGAFTDALHSAETESFYKLKVQVAP